MTTSRPLTVVEDGGLAALRPSGSPSAITGAGLRPAETLRAAAELLIARLDLALLDPVAPAGLRNPAVLRVLREEIGRQVERGAGPLREVPTDDVSLLALFRESLGWGPAQPYLDDERIQEVKIIGDRIMVQEDGADFVVVPERFRTPQQALDRAQLLASRLNVPLDRTHPQGTLPLAHGTRMHVTVPPCTPEGEALICIRRGRRTAWSLEDVLQRGSFSVEVGDLLRLFARAGCSFLIAGETGSGKTALLEAIVNSWPGQPHVITIEDNALEINVRHAAWTRELVQTVTEPGAFGRAAREVLRQTPSIVAPGETRASEAGAILAVAVSGHAVITTLHAKSVPQAATRFADCAAMPDAYSYAGRRNNALEDTCANIEVVIHVEKLGGRRVISAIGLLDGVESQGGRVRPRVVPLVELVVAADGALSWRYMACAEGDALTWASGADQTPSALQRKLRLLRTTSLVRAMPTTRAAIDAAVSRAEQAIQRGQAADAMAELCRAWADRRDSRLISAAQRALEQDYRALRTIADRAEREASVIGAALGRRAWAAAHTRYEAVMGDLSLVAAFTPPGGWSALEAAIRSGMAVDRRLSERTASARAALGAGRPHDALEILGEADVMSASTEVALSALQLRRDALERMIAQGEDRDEALRAVIALARSLNQRREE